MRLSAPLYQLKRRAKMMAHDENIPLHSALDRVAAEEGHQRWSLLASRLERARSAADLLPALEDGDVILLGARPGHGKTRMGLRLLLEAVHDGRRAVFFTLEYTEKEARERIRQLEGNHAGGSIEIVTSDDICAATIGRHLVEAPRGTVAVIDYLQILDQQRSKPPLHDQVDTLKLLARSNGYILAFISQIDRSFDPDGDRLPTLADVRLPNPIDMTAFSKACFIHEEAFEIRAVAV